MERMPQFERLEERSLLSVAAAFDKTVPVGPRPIDVQIGLVDADPYLDMMSLTADGGLSVAMNNGQGEWRNVVPVDLGLAAASGLTLGRFDADTFLDLAVQGPDGLRVARGDVSGGFQVVQSWTPAAAGSLAPSDGGRIGLTAALLNADFTTDLAAVAPGTDEVLVWLGNGSGTFGNPRRYASGGSDPIDVVAGQFIGDPLPDLAVAHRDGTVTSLRGSGGGAFTLEPGATTGELGSLQDLTAGDFDKDGDLDLAASGVSAGNARSWTTIRR